MKKKVAVAVSLIVALVGLLLLLSFTVFSLKSVEVDFRTSHVHITATDDEIIETAGIKKGGSVFLHGKKKYVEKIENFSPYIKVINIETVFPSTFVVHLAERQEIYAIPFENGHYICDEEFRVLRIDNAFESTYSNAILLNPYSPITEIDLKEGDYIKNIEVPPIYQSFHENNRSLAEQSELIESITLTKEINAVTGKEQNVATLKLFSGQTARIIKTERGLVAKVKLLLDAHCQLFEAVGKTLEKEDGNIVLTEDHLKTCTIEINSFYHPDHGADECYFDLIIVAEN